MSKITSFSNPTIKSIRKLADHKERMATGLFLAEGLRVVAEAIQCNAAVESIIYAPKLLVSEFGQSVVKTAQERGIPLIEVTPNIFATFSIKEGPQGIAAVVRQNWHNFQQTFPQPGDTWVALESVQNPGNLGSIMRTVEAIAAKGLILLDQSTDPFDPTAVKASMGAIFSVKLIKADFKTFSSWQEQAHVPVIGTSDKAANDYMDLPYPNPCVLLMGSERQGLPQTYLDRCDQVVRIPMEGRTDSLNLAIATSIILYQIYNQRRRNF
jgi:TrmH family RNA methyltransferase